LEEAAPVALCVTSFFWVDEARSRQRQVQLTPEDVRIWDRMVARNLSIPHRRVCITHRPDLIDFMETVPLDCTKHVPGTCLVKLMVYRPDVGEILGDRIMLMDIDCVVTGSLDEIASRPEPWIGWKNPNFTEGGRRGFFQGSLQLFTAGAKPELWNDFTPATLAWLNRRFGGAEQCWISERLNASYPEPGWEWNDPYLDENDGVYGAGRLFGGKMGNGVQTELPDNARIVFFPGDRSASQSEVQRLHPWIREHLW
jgi:hypothetical protein